MTESGDRRKGSASLCILGRGATAQGFCLLLACTSPSTRWKPALEVQIGGRVRGCLILSGTLTIPEWRPQLEGPAPAELRGPALSLEDPGHSSLS